MIRQFLFLFITPLVLGYLKPKATFPNRPECLKSSHGLIDSTKIYFPYRDPWNDYNDWGYSQQNTNWIKELKFLRYAQDMIDNGTLILNNDCQVSFWDYKEDLLIGPTYRRNLESVCNNVYSVSSQCIDGNDIDHFCLYKYTKIPGYYINRSYMCTNFLTMVEHLLFSDLRLVESFVQDCGMVSEIIECKSLEKPNTEAGNRIPSKSENFGLDCYIRKMFDQPIPNHILSRWEPQLAKCANKVMQLSEHMFQQAQFDRVLTSACKETVDYYSYQRCGSNSYSDEDSYLMCWLKNKNANSPGCIDVVNSRISLIGRNEKLLNRRFLFSQCKSELDFYDCAPNNSNSYIQPIDMLTCLVDGYYNYSKKKSVPSLFGSMGFEDDTNVDVMFKSSCQLEMRSSASRFFQEPRLTPNLMMACAQVLNACYELGLQKDIEIVHCLMYMAGANEQLNDQTKICVETLNKIAKINQVGIQPGFDERLAADCKAFSNECKDPLCIRLNTYDKYDRIKQKYISYPKNYSDPCTQRTIEKRFYTLQNLPEDLIDGRLNTCPNGNYNYPNMYVVAHKENFTRKIDEYFGANPFELLLPFYKMSTGFCNKNQIYIPYRHGAWKASFCPANFTHITLNPNLQHEELKLVERQPINLGYLDHKDMLENGKNFDKYKPSYKVKNGIAQPYFTVNHINGSICKANGLPRTTKVLHFCSPNSYYNLNTTRNHYDHYEMVNEPCETSPCNYEIEVYTYHLCKHPAFLPYLLKTTPIPSTPRPTLEIYEKKKEITWKRNPFTDTPKETTGLPYWASTPEPVYRSNFEFKIPPWVGYFVFGVVMWGAIFGFAIRKYMSRNKDRVLWPRAEGYNEVITT